MEHTEATFSSMNKEFRQLMDERDRLVEMQYQLEQELLMSQSAHMKLEEQRCENERLKQVIDDLSFDLDEARNSRHQRSWSRTDMADNIKVDFWTDPTAYELPTNVTAFCRICKLNWRYIIIQYQVLSWETTTSLRTWWYVAESA